MDNIQRGNSSASGARIASVGSYVHFCREYGGRLWRVFVGEQDALAAVPQREYRRYVEWCAWWFDQQRFAEVGL